MFPVSKKISNENPPPGTAALLGFGMAVVTAVPERARYFGAWDARRQKC